MSTITAPAASPLLGESLIPISDVADMIPSGPRGRVGRACVHQWARRGLRGGRVRLEVVHLPSGLWTSREAVQRFLQALAAAGAPQRRRR